MAVWKRTVGDAGPYNRLFKPTDKPKEDITLYLKGLTPDEKEIILDGCLMNYYAKRMD